MVKGWKIFLILLVLVFGVEFVVSDSMNSAPAAPLGDTAEIRNLNNEIIVEANVGDTVMLYFHKDELNESYSNVTFRIKEYSSWITATSINLEDVECVEQGNSEDEVEYNCTQIINGSITVDTVGDEAVTYWTIKESEVNESIVAGLNTRFVYEITLGGTTYKSNTQFVITNSKNDSPLEISIKYRPNISTEYLELENGLRINESSNLTFLINATDLDDRIFGRFVIGSTNYSFTNGVREIEYNFTESGNRAIIYSLSNSRGVFEREQNNIIVMKTSPLGESEKEIYLAACIEKSTENHIVYLFNASCTTGVLRNSSGNFDIEKENMRFSWKFSDGGVNPYTDGSEEISYIFYKTFHSIGRNWATLDVNYVA